MIIVVYILLKRRTRDYITEVKEKRKRRGYALGTFCVSIGLAGIFCSTLTGTDYSRLAKQWNREYVLGTFGLYTYQFSDVISCTHAKINMMFGYEESEEVSISSMMISQRLKKLPKRVTSTQIFSRIRTL